MSAVHVLAKYQLHLASIQRNLGSPQSPMHALPQPSLPVGRSLPVTRECDHVVIQVPVIGFDNHYTLLCRQLFVYVAGAFFDGFIEDGISR